MDGAGVQTHRQFLPEPGGALALAAGIALLLGLRRRPQTNADPPDRCCS
jgi:hypothetical protein